MVQSLVTQHFRNRQYTSFEDEETDLIKGKGNPIYFRQSTLPPRLTQLC